MDRELVITRVIDAPRILVFRAWTQPEHVVRWWGPHGFTATHCEMDVRVGGAYRVCMRSTDGTEYCKRGVYREIVEPERVVFTFRWENPGNGMPQHELLTTVTFAEQGTQTRLMLRQTLFETAEQRDSHRTGWVSTLQRLAEYLTTQGGWRNATSDRLAR
jgi:uncharacterized protein YndB with AHSA1/START domain